MPAEALPGVLVGIEGLKCEINVRQVRVLVIVGHFCFGPPCREPFCETGTGDVHDLLCKAILNPTTSIAGSGVWEEWGWQAQVT